jgi:hypothetical protein
MSGPPVPSVDDVVDWLTPRQAVDLLSEHYGELTSIYLAKTTLLSRLTAGMVQSVAGHVVLNDEGRVSRAELSLIRSTEWRQVKHRHTMFHNSVVNKPMH